MAFLTQAFDDTDENALARRMAAREAHLESARKLKSDGRLIHAGAILDESGNMIGSMLLFDVESQQEVEALMKGDPYTEKGVWVRWTITPVRLAPL